MMFATPAAGPGGAGLPAQIPESSLPGLHGPPRRPAVPRPSWVVRSESNVRRERPKRCEPPCTICKGTGAIDCRICFGRGRINHVNLVMLPKGEWPQWCQICRGSGLDYCHRCHGTGEYREPMGFHFTANRK